MDTGSERLRQIRGPDFDRYICSVTREAKTSDVVLQLQRTANCFSQTGESESEPLSESLG